MDFMFDQSNRKIYIKICNNLGQLYFYRKYIF